MALFYLKTARYRLYLLLTARCNRRVYYRRHILRPIIEIPPHDAGAELTLADALAVDPGLARVLRARGIPGAEAAARFLFPDVSRLSPPGDFPDLADAAALILRCSGAGDKFFVAGDYDVDGLTATALLTTVIRRLGAPVEYYIPNRLTEGYDLSEDTVRRALDANAQVLITADCGSRAHEAVDAARRAGLAVVVTDHHRLGETLPPANAVVTPQRLPEGHPAGVLAGVGAAYKLAEGILGRASDGPTLTELLPLVALGTVCDVVDLVAENRILAAGGLRAFPGQRFPGLAALMAEAGVGAPISSWHLAFVMGPRLNAAGRLGHADYALELLLAEDESRGRSLAHKLEEFNAYRRTLEARVAAEALEMGAARFEAGRKSIVIAGEGWHPGVIGIVAARLAERFYRPAVLIALEGGSGRGSCRSIPPFDIYEGLREIERYLGRYGGHRAAAGFEIDAGVVSEFAEAFEVVASERLDEGALRPTIRVDGALPLAGATLGLAEDLSLLEPVGEGNPPPSFFTRAVVEESAQRVFKNAHLEIEAAAPHGKVRAIGFNLAEEGGTLEAGVYGLVHSPALSRWRDRERLELKLSYVGPLEVVEGPGWGEIVDMRSRGWQDKRVAPDPRTDAVFGLPSQRPPAGGCEFLAYADYAAAGKRWRRLWLAAPPFGPYRLATFLAAADEVVLAYGSGCELEVREFLAAYYPSRDKLAATYRALRDGGASPLGDNATAERRALAIFAELDLADAGSGALAALPEDEIAPGGAAHRRLEESPLFRRCERRRREAEEFVAGMCRWPLSVLRDLGADLRISARTIDTGGEVS
jgi:single-stranded-DNA-specific exonuclease RecJ